MVKKFNLYKKKVENCQKCQNSEELKINQDEDGYCVLAQPSDRLGARCVGEWGEDKVTFLSTYVGTTGTGLKRSWDFYYYIEICSGPGLCIDKATGTEFIGTAIASLLTEGAKQYTKLFFFDLNPRTVDYLRKRIYLHKDIPQEVKDKTIVEVGDYKNPESILNVLRYNIPENRKGLNVVFVDPTDLSVPLTLYTELIQFGNRSDFIINFANNTDLRRNIVSAFQNPEYASFRKYSEVLGSSEFFEDSRNIEHAKTNQYDILCDKFEEAFFNSFKKYGYQNPKQKQIRSYYKLIFLSKHSRGAHYWDIACRKPASERESGQLLMFDT